MTRRSPLWLPVLLCFGLAASPLFAQPEQKAGTPSKATKPTRVGDVYPLETCPISGKRLGSAGDPVIKLFDGREVRFCCKGCPDRFEMDPAGHAAAVDELIARDQRPLYPLNTSIVTGRVLPDKPFEFVFGNRLVRLGSEVEKAEFLKDAPRLLAELDKAVIAAQAPGYSLDRCIVSEEPFGGKMGEPVDLVLAGRMVRICCKGCKRKLDKDPAKYIRLADEARKPAAKP